MDGEMRSQPVLEARGVSVSFGGVRAVDRVDLALGTSEQVGLIGPNGSGKTTFLNALCGLVPSSGHVRIHGTVLPPHKPLAARRAGLTRVFQAPLLYDELTALENVVIGHDDRRYAGFLSASVRRRRMRQVDAHRLADAERALARVGIVELAEKSVDALSYGQRRLVGLARACISEASVLLLDEPSAGLNDAETERLGAVLAGLASAGMSFLLVDHKIGFVRSCCDRLCVLELGRVIRDGAAADVLEDPEVIGAYIGRSAAT